MISRYRVNEPGIKRMRLAGSLINTRPIVGVVGTTLKSDPAVGIDRLQRNSCDGGLHKLQPYEVSMNTDYEDKLIIAGGPHCGAVEQKLDTLKTEIHRNSLLRLVVRRRRTCGRRGRQDQ